MARGLWRIRTVSHGEKWSARGLRGCSGAFSNEKAVFLLHFEGFCTECLVPLEQTQKVSGAGSPANFLESARPSLCP